MRDILVLAVAYVIALMAFGFGGLSNKPGKGKIESGVNAILFFVFMLIAVLAARFL